MTDDLNALDEDGNTPLHRAARDGHLEVVQLLLEEGAEVNATDEDGDTPLVMAEECDHTDVADFLRQHGAKK